MLFNSVQFIFFFVAVFAAYLVCVHLIKRNSVTQCVLLLFSLFFYACWKPAYLCLIIISVIITFLSGIGMEKYPAKKALVLTLSLVSNLAILFFFKYYNFFADSLVWTASLFGSKLNVPYLNVLLPVGISFYTFQALGYSIDVYKGKIQAEKNFITYALFVTFFPQLVAGPIERTGNLLPQFKVDHKFDYKRVTNGLKLAAWGYFEKVVIADRLAVYVNGIYNNLDVSTGSSLVFATFLFCFQVLCDFSGYSDIAIGVAQVLGFKLMRNFRRPFFSKSIPELWTRWHISLSTWFKDYLYIPMGGSRVSHLRHYFNLAVTFIISGIWHGAAWHYVAWGAMHAFYQIVGIALRPIRTKALVKCHLGFYDASQKSGVYVKRPWQFVQMAVTFILFLIAAIPFRANNMADCSRIYSKIFRIPSEIAGMLSSVGSTGIVEGVRNLLILNETVSGYGIKHALFAVMLIFILLLVDFITRKERGVQILEKQHWIVRWICYYAVTFAIIFLSVNGKTEFVYFQF